MGRPAATASAETARRRHGRARSMCWRTAGRIRSDRQDRLHRRRADRDHLRPERRRPSDHRRRSSGAERERRCAPLVRFDKVWKTYGQGEAKVHALAGVDLAIERGEFVAIMGPSGSGKSTAMNIIGCLDTPTAGTLRLRRASTPAGLDRDRRARAAQPLYRLRLPGLQSAAAHHGAENVELPLIYRGVAQRRAPRRAPCRRWPQVGLAAASITRRPSSPAASSSAWRSRAPSSPSRRCWSPTSRPATSTPPAATRSWTLLTALNRELGLTIVMVTHEPDVAAYAERTIRFLDGHVASDSLAHGGAPDAVEDLQLALRSIRRNVLRSVLTLLGIVIGVAAVIAMITIGSGTTEKVKSDISKLGSNLLVVRAGRPRPRRRHVVHPARARGEGRGGAQQGARRRQGGLGCVAEIGARRLRVAEPHRRCHRHRCRLLRRSRLGACRGPAVHRFGGSRRHQCLPASARRCGSSSSAPAIRKAQQVRRQSHDLPGHRRARPARASPASARTRTMS